MLAKLVLRSNDLFFERARAHQGQLLVRSSVACDHMPLVKLPQFIPRQCIASVWVLPWLHIDLVPERE